MSGGGTSEMLGEDFVGGWNATELALKRVNERIQFCVRDSLLRERDQRVLRLALASVRLGEQHLRAIE